MVHPLNTRASITRHQPRQVRGPIETRQKGDGPIRLCWGHQPRQVRGPIETMRRPNHGVHYISVTSRAKCAALLKLQSTAVLLMAHHGESPAAPSARPY